MCVTGTDRSPPPPLDLGMSKRGGGVFRRADDVTRECPRGGACECPRVGAFFKLMTSRGQCPRGVCLGMSSPPHPLQEILYPRLVFHPSKFRPPPPPPPWLAGYGPALRLLAQAIGSGYSGALRISHKTVQPGFLPGPAKFKEQRCKCFGDLIRYGGSL